MNWKRQAKQLYARENYEDCLKVLYDNTSRAKAYVWGLIIFSYILDALSFWLSNYIINHNSVVAGAAVAIFVAVAEGAAVVAGAAVAIFVAVAAGAAVVAGAAGAIFAAGAAVAIFVAGAAGAAGAEVAIFVAVAAGAAVADFIIKKICKKTLEKI